MLMDLIVRLESLNRGLIEPLLIERDSWMPQYQKIPTTQNIQQARLEEMYSLACPEYLARHISKAKEDAEGLPDPARTVILSQICEISDIAAKSYSCNRAAR